jgi:hypothetical protein
MLVEFIQNLLLTIIGLVLGGYILFFGRRALWATLGVIGLVVAANLLAIFVAGGESGLALIDLQAWGLIGIAVAVGLLGVLLGRFIPDLAVGVIGVAAGADIALWLYEIAAYLVTDIARLPEQYVTWVGVGLIIIGGLAGLWLVRNHRDQTLILVTMLIGTELIRNSVGLNTGSSLTAMILLSLALAGVLVQYADYLRAHKASQPLSELEPDPASVAYFQDLEMDEG